MPVHIKKGANKSTGGSIKAGLVPSTGKIQMMRDNLIQKCS